MRFATRRYRRGAFAIIVALSLAIWRCGSDEWVQRSPSDDDKDATTDKLTSADISVGVDGPVDDVATERGDSGPEVETADAASTGVFEQLSRLSLPPGGPVVTISARGDLAVLGRARAAGPELVVVRTEPAGSGVITGTLEIDANVNAVALEGRRAYLATSDDQRELMIVDVTDAAAPSLMGGLDAPGDADATALDAAGNRVLLGRVDGPSAEISFIDASNAGTPLVVGSIDVAGDVTDVEMQNSFAYIATNSASAELVVLDYEGLPYPYVTNASDAGASDGSATDALVDGRSIDVGDAGAVMTAATFDLPGPARALDLNAQRLYVVGGQGRGYLVELDAPTRVAPTLLSSIEFDTEPTDLLAYGNHLFIAAGGSVRVYDRVLPPLTRNPGLVDSLTFEFGAQSLAFDDHVLLVGGATSSLLGFVRADVVPRVEDRNQDGFRTVAVLGDSNSARPYEPTWVNDLYNLLVAPDWVLANRAEPYASLIPLPGYPDAWEQLVTALANDSPDAVVLAFGTNDIRFYMALAPYGLVLGEEPMSEIVDNYAKLRERCEREQLTPFIGLTPPAYDSDLTTQLIFELNHQLRNSFDPAILIDFNSTMIYPDDYEDGVHVGPSGSAKRALEGWRKFEPEYTLPMADSGSTR